MMSKVPDDNGILIESQADNLFKSGLDTIECKSSQTFNEAKKVRTGNNNHSELVNYVSFADPIT